MMANYSSVQSSSNYKNVLFIATQSDLSEFAKGWIKQAIGCAIIIDIPRVSNIIGSSTSNSGLDAEPAVKAKQYWESIGEFQPKTALGKKLWEMRKKHIASGAQLLTWDQIAEEKARLRGESVWEIQEF